MLSVATFVLILTGFEYRLIRRQCLARVTDGVTVVHSGAVVRQSFTGGVDAGSQLRALAFTDSEGLVHSGLDSDCRWLLTGHDRAVVLSPMHCSVLPRQLVQTAADRSGDRAGATALRLPRLLRSYPQTGRASTHRLSIAMHPRSFRAFGLVEGFGWACDYSMVQQLTAL